MCCNACVCSLIGCVIVSTEGIDTLLYNNGQRPPVNVTTEARCGQHPVTNIALTPALRHQTVIAGVSEDLLVQRVGKSSIGLRGI